MSEKLKKFLEELSNNEELAEKLTEINEKYPDKEDNAKALAELAKEFGIDILAEDLLSATDTTDSSDLKEISDDELEQVTGGKMKHSTNRYMVPCGMRTDETYVSDCFCLVGGSGSSDSLQKKCTCVIGGGGELTSAGKNQFAGFSGTKLALVCVGIGDNPEITRSYIE